MRNALAILLALAAPLAAHAQTANKSAFILNEYDVHDPAAFKQFVEEVDASLKPFSGQSVLREKVVSPFGGVPASLVVITFPSVVEARAWLASPDYAKLKTDRDKAASARAYLVETLD